MEVAIITPHCAQRQALRAQQDQLVQQASLVRRAMLERQERQERQALQRLLLPLWLRWQH